MFFDGGMALSTFDDLAMGVRKRIMLGVPRPGEAWLPVVVAGATDAFALRRVTARLAAEEGGGVLGTWEDVRPFQPVSRRHMTGWARGLGSNYAFACVRADFTAAPPFPANGRWVVIEADVMTEHGDMRHLSATTFLAISALPTPDGWHAGDMHLHSTVSDGILSVDETVGHAKEASGLGWLVLTDHASAIRDWSVYVTHCVRVQAGRHVLVCPGAEFVARRWLGEGHALGYSMRIGDDATLPPASGTPQAVIDSIAAQGPSSFSAIAHPYHWLYDWPDWRVTGVKSVELATGAGSTAQLSTVERWFRLLRRDLAAWSGDEGSVSFVVGLASTDSHSIPLSVMPGERHVNWVCTGSSTPPAEPDVLFRHLRAGHCVASCGGDFGTLRINGSGPGSVCTSDGHSPLACEFQAEPRGGNRLITVGLYGPSGRVGQWGWPQSGTLACNLEPPQKRSFYVARFIFADGAGRLWEEWANPVWVRV